MHNYMSKNEPVLKNECNMFTPLSGNKAIFWIVSGLGVCILGLILTINSASLRIFSPLWTPVIVLIGGIICFYGISGNITGTHMKESLGEYNYWQNDELDTRNDFMIMQIAVIIGVTVELPIIMMFKEELSSWDVWCSSLWVITFILTMVRFTMGSHDHWIDEIDLIQVFIVGIAFLFWLREILYPTLGQDLQWLSIFELVSILLVFIIVSQAIEDFIRNCIVTKRTVKENM